MQMTILSNNFFLDNYILNKELCEKVGISSNAYRFWKDVKAARYDRCRAVFLEKKLFFKNTKILFKSVQIYMGWFNQMLFAPILVLQIPIL